MSAYSLTGTQFREGVWEGLLRAEVAGAGAPEIVVTLLDQPVTGVMIKDTGEEGRWLLQIPVPLQAVGEGVRTFLILDASSDEVLGSFAIIAGEVLGDDIRAEVDLLRAELDMLKRAFRRHCVETT
ncbi:hypothetical protein ACOXXX_16170 [Thalassococcus sp. BH17M4-6]|uniref:hypothetical protein n=1 Tax=Thalassococcus sp. BH17M4-6 TaxID=3413148 RepID=UPI003BE98B41